MVCSDAFVAKLDPAGALVWATCLGGSDHDWATAVALDAAGDVSVTGGARSLDFPTAPGAVQGAHGSSGLGGCEKHNEHPCPDAFVATRAPDGSALVYSTLLGADGFDEARGIGVDATGRAVVAGMVGPIPSPSPFGAPPGGISFPTANAPQPVYGGGRGDGFVAMLNATGTALVYEEAGGVRQALKSRRPGALPGRRGRAPPRPAGRGRPAWAGARRSRPPGSAAGPPGWRRR